MIAKRLCKDSRDPIKENIACFAEFTVLTNKAKHQYHFRLSFFSFYGDNVAINRP